MARLSLRWIVFVALTIATIAPLAYLGPEQITRWRDVQRRESDKELKFAVEALSRAAVQTVAADVRGLETTAGEIGMRSPLTPEFLTAAIHVHLERFRGLDGAAVTDLDGLAVAAEPPGIVGIQYKDRHYFHTMMETGWTTISPEVTIGKILHNPSIHVGVPIRVTFGADRGKSMGYLVASVGLQHLRTVALGVVDTLDDVKARLLDGHLRVIVDSDPEGASAFTDMSAVKAYVAAPDASVAFRDGPDEQDRAIRAAVSRISELGLDWTVVVTRPASKVEEQARHAVWVTWVALSGALSLGLLMSLGLSSWLARPIRRLARYTVEVGHGASVPLPSPDAWDAREVADLVRTVGTMVSQLRSQADALREHEAEQIVLGRLRRELEIAQRIQSGILPKQVDLPGFEVAATMKAAEEVGGDYYEIHPDACGCWVAIGDACGHGLNAGLVMLMLQSAIGALLAYGPGAGPAELLKAANQLLVENIRNRLGEQDYVTLVLMQLSDDGRFLFAGAHEPFLLLRRATGRCELVETVGVWMGLTPIAPGMLPEGSGRLDVGDVIVLYSDGIVERGASMRNPFGIERLCAVVERFSEQESGTICREVLQAAQDWAAGKQDDDMTVLVLRYLGPRQERPASGAQ